MISKYYYDNCANLAGAFISLPAYPIARLREMIPNFCRIIFRRYRRRLRMLKHIALPRQRVIHFTLGVSHTFFYTWI
jgi:hypothetical protein